jgi:hypothetical protein
MSAAGWLATTGTLSAKDAQSQAGLVAAAGSNCAETAIWNTMEGMRTMSWQNGQNTLLLLLLSYAKKQMQYALYGQRADDICEGVGTAKGGEFR